MCVQNCSGWRFSCRSLSLFEEITLTSFIINKNNFHTVHRTPLMLAVLNGHAECVYSLLSQGASVEKQDRWGRTALHRGVRHSHTPTNISTLCFIIAYLFLVFFSTLLFLSQAVTGQEEIVEALLQRGASVCVRDIRGRSPVHLASACGRVGVLGALLQATTTPSHTQTHLTDNQGYTPLHWACYNGTGAQHNSLEICSV